MKSFIVAAMVAFGLSLLLCRILIPLLKRIKAGQNILSYVKEHKGKSGTPTMGGIAFVLAAFLTAIIFQKTADRAFILTLVIGLAYMIVGLLDDGLKCLHKENLGLKAWQKFVFQGIIAIAAGIYCFRAALTQINIPFFNASIELGWWIIPWTVFTFLATVNAVNLTDGLDGLAAGNSLPFFIAFGVIIHLQQGNDSLVLLSFCLSGAVGAYLLFNTHPATIFMGDTGSLALGGFASCIACFTGNALYIVVVGVCFVASVVSVIVQVVYYKVTKGKRVFLMAPIHHHFQQKGYSETKIAYAYSIFTGLMGLLCIIALL